MDGGLDIPHSEKRFPKDDSEAKVAAAEYQSDPKVVPPEDSVPKMARFRSRKPGKKAMVKRKRATIFARK